jgi:hypothetical protein
MGRMTAHTGQEITCEDIINGYHEFAPDVDVAAAIGRGRFQVLTTVHITATSCHLPRR